MAYALGILVIDALFDVSMENLFDGLKVSLPFYP
jgi:hypothetical protein